MSKQEMSPQAREQYAALMAEARLKLSDAEKAWDAACGAAPAGEERRFAAAVCERIYSATRSPIEFWIWCLVNFLIGSVAGGFLMLQTVALLGRCASA